MSDPLQVLRESRPVLEEWVAGLATAREVMAGMVFDAYLAGASYREIAAASGYSHQRVHQLVQAAQVATTAA